MTVLNRTLERNGECGTCVLPPSPFCVKNIGPSDFYTVNRQALLQRRSIAIMVCFPVALMPVPVR